MKRVNHWRARFIALTLAAGLAAVAAPAAQKPDLFSELYARGAAKQKTMTSLRARFTETTTNSLLTRPIVAKGTLMTAAPARVRMVYTEPDAKTLTMDGKMLTIVWPSRNERQQINVTETQKRIDHYFTSASVKELRSLFDIDARPDAKIRDHDVIDMKPKRKQISQGLTSLELWIDRKSDMLTQMRMTFPGGDQKTIALEDLELNVPVNDAMFRQ